MLNILPRKNIIKMFFTVNQLLKILCETARKSIKKEIARISMTRNFTGQIDAQI